MSQAIFLRQCGSINNTEDDCQSSCIFTSLNKSTIVYAGDALYTNWLSGLSKPQNRSSERKSGKAKTMQNNTVEVFDAKFVNNSNRVVLSDAQRKVRRQVEMLQKHFPNLRNPDFRVVEKKLPYGATEWLAVPMWQCLSPSYSRALLKMILAVNHTVDSSASYGHFQGLCSQVIENLSRQRLQHKTDDAIQQLHAEQGYRDIVIVAVQFGEVRHSGRNLKEVRRAMRAREFGLGVFHILTSCLTQPWIVEEEQMVVGVGDHDGEFEFHENQDAWACCLTRSEGVLEVHWKDGYETCHLKTPLKHVTGFRW